MSVSTAMTAIADKIRGLLGLTGTMGLDAMASNLAVEQANIADAFEAVSNKGGTVPESQVSGNLAVAIGTISTGGIDTSDATATAEDIVSPATAYVDGTKITGSLTAGAIDTKVGSLYVGVDSDDNLYFQLPNSSAMYGKRRVVDVDQNITLRYPISNLGDAAASDVAAGKTFTSAAGLMVTGTREDSGGLNIVSDGEGNVTITAPGSAVVTSDGEGNVVIQGGSV